MPAGDARVCPACQARNKAKWEFCVRCGESLHEVPVGEEPGGGGHAWALALEAPPDADSGAVLGWMVTLVLVAGVVVAGVYARQAIGEPEPPSPAVFALPTPPTPRPPALPDTDMAPPMPSEAYLEGRRLLLAGDARGAVALLARAVSEDPGDAEAHHVYAKALWDTEALEAAVQEYRQAARLMPDRVEYRVNLARALVVTGQGSEAIGEYQAALEREPAHRAARQEVADAYVRAGDLPGAVAVVRAGTGLAPGDAGLQQRLGGLLESSGNREGALAAYRSGLSASPGSAPLRAALADLLYRENRKDDALAVLREGAALPGAAPSLHRKLGEILERDGRLREAAAAYRDYARLAPNAPDAKAASDRAASLERAS